MPSSATRQHRRVEIIHATGLEGARNAKGVVVVIDVLRSFTVSAYALAGGARECLLVSTVDDPRELAQQIPEATICAEEDGLPSLGIAISDSPTHVAAAHMRARTALQPPTHGT